MNTNRFISLFICVFIFSPCLSFGQHVKMGEVLVISNSSLRHETKSDDLQKYVEQLNPSLNKINGGIYVLKADRGDRKGESLVVFSLQKESDRKKLSKNPFTDKIFSANDNQLAHYLINPLSYTEYRLIGSDELSSLPEVDILGIHYIKVKPDASVAFEKFVKERLNPTVGKLLPDMQLFYYKAFVGDHAGTYITIFAIESVKARDKYWPEGSEMQIVKDTFRPLSELAKELSQYLVEGSYLPPESGGGAAYFESKEWTDFVLETK